MLNGSCLCGSVAYEIAGEVQEIGHCHCSMCRKIHGAAFGTYGRVARDAFRFTAGSDHVVEYRSSHDVTRTFCKECGSTLQFIRDDRANIEVAVGTLDCDPGIKPTYQIWTRDKAPWWHLESGLRSNETED